MSQFYPEYPAIHRFNENIRYREVCGAEFHSLLVASEFCFLFACFLIAWLCFVGFLVIVVPFDLELLWLRLWYTDLIHLGQSIVAIYWMWTIDNFSSTSQLRFGLFYTWRNGQECVVFASFIGLVRLKGLGSGWMCIHRMHFTGMKT